LRTNEIWGKCLSKLEHDLPEQEFNMWVRPLQAYTDGNNFRLLAPNRFVKDWLDVNLAEALGQAVSIFSPPGTILSIEVGTQSGPTHKPANVSSNGEGSNSSSLLNPDFTFESHVEGKSNQLARAAARQVGENPGRAYNPLFIYGGVGLGKTHLMQAAGNLIAQHKPDAKIVYVHSERFVSDMVKALQKNAMAEFKAYYRSLEALLIDDIQFFAGKSQSQEEFFHTFNTLYESGSQIIITSDRFPKEINNVQERLISRFESGLTLRIDPPELETRVAILSNKARAKNIDLPEDVAFFVAQQIRSNVRELEGALHRLIAGARFTGKPIDLELAKDALRDLTIFQERKISTGRGRWQWPCLKN
jgi:chromosomal replication initiator protein